MHEYKVVIKRSLDGDTVECDVDLGFGIWMKDQHVRLFGINAPETRTKDLVVKESGLKSKTRLQELLPVGSEQILRSVKGPNTTDAKDKYGRILGDFIVLETTTSKILLDEGLAKEY